MQLLGDNPNQVWTRLHRACSTSTPRLGSATVYVSTHGTTSAACGPTRTAVSPTRGVHLRRHGARCDLHRPVRSSDVPVPCRPCATHFPSSQMSFWHPGSRSVSSVRAIAIPGERSPGAPASLIGHSRDLITDFVRTGSAELGEGILETDVASVQALKELRAKLSPLGIMVRLTGTCCRSRPTGATTACTSATRSRLRTRMESFHSAPPYRSERIAVEGEARAALRAVR